ncbi:17-beta-hydroxysteroid dehydrogenase type 6-like [Anolis sagrei]|uniref:17-beta-hydroxysteroid dehydrogenase type 6-like n=1 Tax=Anolis sagrei TaxID=38937 RepID=UPI003520D81E
MWIYLAALLGLYFLRRWYRERQNVEKLTDKYVFITGCDTGFGHQLARQLDAQGLQVLAACLTQKGAEELERISSERLKTTILDVTSTESVKEAMNWVKGCVGHKGLWGLVNNAGIGNPSGPNEWLTKDDFARLINVNLLGTIDVTLQMLPLLRKARGRVVNMSSINGRLANTGNYSVTKFGVEAFSDSLRRELCPFGIKVSIIEPGVFTTNILNNVEENFRKTWDRAPSDIKEAYGQQYLESCCTLISQAYIKKANTNLYLVTDCMEHALMSRYPRTRYSAGLDAKLFYIPLSYMPTFVGDYVMTCFAPKPAQAV